MDAKFFSCGKSVYNRAKHEGAEKLLSQALKVLAHTPDSNYRRLAQALGKMAKSKQQALVADWFQGYPEPGGVGSQYFNRLLKNVDPQCTQELHCQDHGWSALSRSRGFHQTD